MQRNIYCAIYHVASERCSSTEPQSPAYSPWKELGKSGTITLRIMIWQYLFCLFKNSIFFVTFCIVKSACTCTHTTILEFSLLIFLKQSKRNGEHTRFCCCQAVLDCDPVCALWAQLLVDMVLPVQILQCWQCLGWEVLVCHLRHMGRALPKRGKGIYPQGEHFYFFPEDSWKNLSAWCILYINFFFLKHSS